MSDTRKQSQLNPSIEKTRKNETYARLMGELLALMVKRGDNIRARVYRRAQETILSVKEDIYDSADLVGKPGIGPVILEKLKTYDETGTLDILEREKENPENILSDVYGIGPKKAKELVDTGITSIAQLRERQNEVLNEVQKVGLKYYEDIQEKIPRKEIDEYVAVFQSAYDVVSKKTPMKYEIVGSYRRGATVSGDIDVIITAKDANAFNEWINELLGTKLIIEVLSRGKSKCLVITRLQEGYVARRVDFLYTTLEEYPFAVLYFTGSKGFNATMRGFVLTKGLSLNEHGLSKMVDKKKEEKLVLNMADERAIFDYLGLVYKEPRERIDGRAVVPINGKATIVPIIENDNEEGIMQKSVEKNVPKLLSNQTKRSPKTQKNKTRKVPKDSKDSKDTKVPKDPEQIEMFCHDFLEKRKLDKQIPQKEMVEKVSKVSSTKQIPQKEMAEKEMAEKEMAEKDPKVSSAKQIPQKEMAEKVPKVSSAKQIPQKEMAEKVPKVSSIKQIPQKEMAEKDMVEKVPKVSSAKQIPQKEITEKEMAEKVPKVSSAKQIPQKEITEKQMVEKVPKVSSTKKTRKRKPPKISNEPMEQEIPVIVQRSPISENQTSPWMIPKPSITKKRRNIGEPKVHKLAKNKTKKLPKLGEIEKIEYPKLDSFKKQSNKVLQESQNIQTSSPKTLETSQKTNIKILPQSIEMPKQQTETKETIYPIIQKFKNNGITVLEKLSQEELAALLRLANDNYYNEQAGLLTDNEYDIIKEYMEKKYPTNAVMKQIGAPIARNKVKLPYEMWSMDKIKPDSNALSGWTKKYRGPYVLSCKLDGVSGLYSTEGQVPKLYTRGDGKVGQDVSFLLPILKLPVEKGIVVRGEFMIPKKVFEEKYAKQFANPRNLVSGIVNSKKADEKTVDLHFVTYEVIMPQLKPSEQLAKLKAVGFEIVQTEVRAALSNENLSETLVDWRTNYEYEIDGVIVTDDAIHPRISGNPDHAFAFKMVLSDQKAEVKVVDVLWSPSKDGFLKPRVRIEPVNLGGVTIEYATGYNAKFIEDNKIGIGAIVEIIRSGDVIPKILSVTVPAEKAKMPLESYKWNETRVDVLLENAGENATVQEKNLTAFFIHLEVEGLKAGNIKKLMAAGYDTVPKILAMTKEDFVKVGYKSLADKYVENIREKVDGSSVVDLMVASGTMGRGLGAKKIEPILEAHHDILVSKDSPAEKIAKVKSVKGIENKTATLFVENIPRFVEFLESIGQSQKLQGEAVAKSSDKADEPTVEIDKSNALYGKKVVMTKVRDQDIIRELKARGATLEDTIGSKTFVLIVKSMDDVSNKTKYAVEHGIPIMTPEEFKGKFLV